ncbi:hypothetical protein K0U07_03535, partial [bacterium]|nr:hypothetical protein [bacterium]
SFKGSHFSVAHFSTDVDTVVASFHGFLDAFAAKVGTGVHYWQVPGGPPAESIEIENLFFKALHKNVFDICSKSSRDLFIGALDLVSQKNIVTKELSDRSIGREHGRMENSVVVTGENGEYIADWRAIDYDEVRTIIHNFMFILRSFEKSLYMVAVEFLLNKADFNKKVIEILALPLSHFFGTFSSDEVAVDRLELFTKEILGLEAGLSTSFEFFLFAQKECASLAEELKKTQKAVEIEAALKLLHSAFEKYYHYLDSLEVAVAIKQRVLKISPLTISHLDDYATIVEKMGTYPHLTVVYEEKDRLTPLGVIHARDLKKETLATVSVRDFSNNDEMDKAPYMDIISCIDHHKSTFATNKPARIVVSDAQSSNSIIAAINMAINEGYATRGYSLAQVEKQIKERGAAKTTSDMRLMKRLLSKKEALLQKQVHFIAPEKEFLDYYHFLFAILDDTDLLTKVTPFDVCVVRDLLNNMKSLMLKSEVEIVHFDGLDKEARDFAYVAARKLLQTHDLYSLYHANYQKREQKIDEMLKKATSTYEKAFFQDTKVLSKYAQVGQVKLFSSNHMVLSKKRADIQKHWLKRCQLAADKNSDLSVFVFMVSTVDSADDLFAGGVKKESKIHDEIWITCLDGDRNSYEKARKFLERLLKSPKVYPQTVDLHLYGKMTDAHEASSKVSGRVAVSSGKGKIPLAEVLVDLKSIKSRKSDIAPYL